MFGKRVNLFKLLGFQVSIDWSWIIIAVLIVWSLSSGFFPYLYGDLSRGAYFWMGVAGALGLFLSIIVHEFSHSLVARKYGIPMKGITLFIFGGVAEMSEEPPNAKSEFWMAAVGPLSSFLIGGIFYSIYKMSLGTLSTPVSGVIRYLAIINGILAAFNLLPAFPLDGGRILRSIIWSIRKDIRTATRISSKIGSGFAYGFIFLGILNILRGNFVGGMWWVLIGMFLRGAARSSYQQLIIRRSLEGEKVRSFMKTDPVTVMPGLLVSELVEDYIYKYHFKMFPVLDGDNLKGCVTTREVKGLPKEEWKKRTVGDIAIACSPENTIEAHVDAVKALSRMHRTGLSRLMVTDGQRLVGIITLKDLMRFLSIKVDLEEG
jgi:Zn-dependent protease